MGSLLLKVHFCLEFPFWLKLAAKNETHQALQNNVNRIITLSHACIHARAHTQANSFVAHCSSLLTDYPDTQTY